MGRPERQVVLYGLYTETISQYVKAREILERALLLTMVRMEWDGKEPVVEEWRFDTSVRLSNHHAELVTRYELTARVSQKGDDDGEQDDHGQQDGDCHGRLQAAG